MAFSVFVTSGLDFECSGSALVGSSLEPSRGADRGESERPRTELLLDPGLPLFGMGLRDDPVLDP